MLSGWVFFSPQATVIYNKLPKKKEEKNLGLWKGSMTHWEEQHAVKRLLRWAFIIHFVAVRNAPVLSEETSGHINTNCPCARRQWSALISSKVDKVWERWEAVKALQLLKEEMDSTISPQPCCAFSRTFSLHLKIKPSTLSPRIYNFNHISTVQTLNIIQV